jgi:hypothetical protein
LAGFLVGFVLVLCIGNYFRAKRAQERQRERRLERIAAQADKVDDSTHISTTNINDNGSMTSALSEQHQRLIAKTLKFQQMQNSSANPTQRRRSTGVHHEPSHSPQHEFLLSV